MVNGQVSTGLIRSTYNESANYDPCREWLRLLVATVSLIAAAVAVYPLHIAVECYFDNTIADRADLVHCQNLLNLEVSVTILVAALIIEGAMIVTFCFACRHEFLGVRRDYKRPIRMRCCASRTEVHPVPEQFNDE